MERFDLDKRALREIYVILNKLNLYSRIPKDFQSYIEEKQDDAYMFEFNEKMPLYEQLENSTTKEMLAYLFIKYINTSSEDAQNIKEKVIDLMKK